MNNLEEQLCSQFASDKAAERGNLLAVAIKICGSKLDGFGFDIYSRQKRINFQLLRAFTIVEKSPDLRTERLREELKADLIMRFLPVR